MKKDSQTIDINKLEPYEICLLKGEIIRIIDYPDNFKEEEYSIKAFNPTVTYSFTKQELNEIESIYNDLYPLNANNDNDNDLFLYEGMIGVTKGDIFYPGLNSCIGITIILKNANKIGVHFVLPMGNYKSAERYISNIKWLFSFFKETKDSIYRVEVSGKEGFLSIAAHIEDLVSSEIFLDIIENYIKPLFEVAGLKIDKDSKDKLAVINYTSKNTKTDLSLQKTVNSQVICRIKYNFEE